MASKQYIPMPVTAYQFDPKDTSELEKLGLTFDDAKAFVTGPSGNTRDITEGDYISLDSSGDFRVFGKDYFESHFVEYGASTSTVAKKATA